MTGIAPAQNPAAGDRTLTLVLGGARSGKSRFAEALIAGRPPPWVYIATAEVGDAEMVERVAAHQARRSVGWSTIEAPRDLCPALAASRAAPVLVDCLTLWLSNLLLAEADIARETDRLVRALEHRDGPIALVSNEVGSGIVPDTALGRRFRDLQGLLNQRIAAQADHVVLVVAGLPLYVKGSPKELS